VIQKSPCSSSSSFAKPQVSSLVCSESTQNHIAHIFWRNNKNNSHTVVSSIYRSDSGRLSYMGTLNDRDTIRYSLQEMKDNIHRKVSIISRQKLSCVSRKISRRHKICTGGGGQHFRALLWSKAKEWHGKMDSKFPLHACILYCDAPTTPTVLRDIIRGIQYILLMQFLTIINRPQTL